MPKDKSIKSVLLIGSGPIVIGQACEFDYSDQACGPSRRRHRNHPHQFQPSDHHDRPVKDHVYLEPLEPASIEKILEKHPNIDSVLPTMGGQTALNLAFSVMRWAFGRGNVRMIGVDIDAIEITENRERFRI